MTFPTGKDLQNLDRLEPRARQACLRSRRFGSEHPRGVALLTSSGKIFDGAELTGEACRDLAATCSAEQVALYQALTSGVRRIRTILIRGGRLGRGDGGPPRGATLQILSEFSPGARVYWGTSRAPKGGLRVCDLLPGAFDSSFLERSSRGQR